jgi:RHS repeat-associated protein
VSVRLATLLLSLLFASTAISSDQSEAVMALVEGRKAPPVEQGGTDYARLAEENGALPLYGRLQDAWLNLSADVARILSSDDPSLLHAPLIEDRYQSLRALDELYRHRLNNWIEDQSLPTRARDGARAELAGYLETTVPWREMMDAWLERADEVREASLAGFFYWLTDFYSRWQLNQLRAELRNAEVIASRRPILGNSQLPLSVSRLAPTLSLPQQPVTPVYSRATNSLPSDEDLAATPLAPLSDAILEKAEALGNDPVRIVNFVRQNTRTEWYGGAMKGAQRTLTLGAGNDVDQAALLVALLRASAIPARFETGVVRIPVGELADSLGIQDPARLRRALQRNGRAAQPVIEQGRISAFDMEYTWVAARVPYANYRGAQVDKSGKVWVPLMPAADGGVSVQGRDYIGAAGLTITDPVAAYQQGAAQVSPLAWLDRRVREALPEEAQTALDEQLWSETEQDMALLPSSPAYEVRAVSEESAALPERLLHRVVITVPGSPPSGPLLKKTMLLADVDGQRLTLSYMPATREIQNTVNSFGGLYTTPAWLVSLRPQLRLNGKRIAVGEGQVAMGETHAVEIELHSPAGTRKVSRNWLAGGYYALSLVAQQVEDELDYSSKDVADTEHTGARLLSQVAAQYNRAWLADEQALSRLAGHRLARAWPVLAIAANSFQPEFVVDRLQALRWEGVSLDAALHISDPVAVEESTALSAAQWARFSALQGSWRESWIFGDIFAVAAVSADKGLRIAAEDNLAVAQLDESSTTGQLDLPPHVIADIERWLDRGFQVTVPVTELDVEDWRGAVWRVEDPGTGSTGYFISGGLAGGQTAEDDWPSDDRERSMRNTYADPSTGAVGIGMIRKLGGIEQRFRGPGEEGDPLMVQVIDDLGRPVVDRPVTFSKVVGDVELVEQVAISNEFGIAQVPVVWATQVSTGNAGWAYLDPQDEHPTQVGISLVNASVIGLRGRVVSLRRPFNLVLKPGPASVDTSTLLVPGPGLPGIFSGNFKVTAKDDYGNLVANAEVGAEYTYTAPGDFRPGGFSKSETEDCSPGDAFCASQNLEDVTDALGLSVIQWIPGVGEATETYTFTLEGEELREINGSTGGYDISLENPPVDITSSVDFTPDGQINTATGVRDTMSKKKTVTMRWPQREWEEQDGVYDFKETIESLIPAAPGEGFGFKADHVDIQHEYVGEGVYELTITGGDEPGVDFIEVEGKVTIDAKVWWDGEANGGDGAFLSGEVQADVDKRRVPGEVWVVRPKVQGVISAHPEAPTSLILDNTYPEALTARTASVATSIEPASFPAQVNILRFLKKDGFDLETIAFPSGGAGTLPSGLAVDAREQYQLIYKIDQEIESEPRNVPLYQPIFESPRDGREFSSTIELDVYSDWSCTRGGTIAFKLIHPAVVTAEVGGQVVIDGEELPEGYHTLSYVQTPGTKDYSITAQSMLDGHIEQRSGTSYTALKFQSLPIGHTIVEGVNIFNGNLSLNRTDFKVGGRGPGIEFNRFYTLNGAAQTSPFGRGWGHSYNGSVQALGCGAYQVAGGLGGGGRFYEEGGSLVPAKGYHGSLVRNDVSNSFDFYAKNGNRYHYKRYSFDPDGRWSLAYVEDPNGNKVSLSYDQSADRPKLLFVKDDAGRKLAFYYSDQSVGGGASETLVDYVTGPNGYRVDYGYDDDGRLTSSAIRNGGNDKTETYTYPEVEPPFEDIYEYLERHNLESVTSPLGYTTTYDYERLPFSSLAGSVPNYAVSSITRETEQNGNVSMSFNYSSRTAGGNLTTDVNNFRGDPVNYVMDESGRILSQSLPNISYDWYDDDILMRSKTEQYQFGALTTVYEYDQYGNKTSEKLNNRPAVITRYKSPGNFSPAYIKNRVSSVKDRNGHKTEYSYNGSGNLTRIDYPDGNYQAYTYAGNGDRKSARDRNGNTTTYSHDQYGYVTSEKTSDCCDMGYKWNALGHKLEETDGRENTTRLYPDKLGYVSGIDYPMGVSESFEHDSMGNVTEKTDRRGHVITRRFDEAGRMTSEEWRSEAGELLEDRSRTYDPHGNLVSEIDPRGVETQHEYDARDHKTRTWTNGATLFGSQTRETIYQVDEQGNVEFRDEGLGRTTEYEYNDLGLPEKIVDAEDHDIVMTYDDEGNLKTRENRRDFTTTFVYDEVNRKIREEAPLGRTLSWDHDGNGNVILEVDANNNETHRTWTQHGELATMYVLENGGGRVTEQTNTYDDAGNLKRSVNSRNFATEYHYDDLNRLTRKERPSPLGDIEYTDHDAAGNVLEEQWPNGNTIDRTWDHRNRLLTETDDMGLRKARIYDANGNALTRTDARGTTTTLQYNDFNELEREELPQHSEGDLIVTYEYDRVGNQRHKRVNDTLSTTSGQMVWETRYDNLGRPTHEYDPVNTQPKVTVYDAEGNIDTVTDKRGILADHTHDELNRLVKVVEAKGTAVQRTREMDYDPHGNLVWEEDGRDIITEHDYDGLHRRIKTWRDTLLVDERKFDGEGNMLWEEDARGFRTGYEYYDANLLEQETGEEAWVVRYTYNSTGDRKTRRDPENRTTRWDYDKRRRKVAETNDLQERTEFRYNGNGDLTAKISPRNTSGDIPFNAHWIYQYTLGGELDEVQDPVGNITDYQYDARGNRIKAVDGKQKTRNWYYDDLSRLDKVVYADGTSHSYLVYDGNNNLEAETDPNGNLIQHDYDALNRREERRFQDDSGSLETRETFVYDDNNNLKQVTEARNGQSWITSYDYDRFDRRTFMEDRFGETVVWGYDNNGNRKSLKSSSGHQTTYQYDRRNRLEFVINAEGSNQYSYYRNGLLKGIEYASGASADYVYDDADRIDTITNRHNGAEVSFYDYDYDDNGNRTCQLERNGFGEEVTEYDYDPADRLANVLYPDGTTEDYVYDAAWNRDAETITDAGGQPVSQKDLTYNDRHQLTDIQDSVDAANNVTFGYDDNGNQVQKLKAGVTTDFVFDARDRLRSVTTGGSTVGQFLYDYQGLRTEKQGERGTERYTYDDQSVLFQTDDTGTPTARFEYGPNRLLSLKEPALPTEFYLFDALRSPVTLVRKDGSVSARYAYDAWGEKRHNSGDSFNRFGFTGHEHDEETGLIYAKARYYDPEIARFLSTDPFDGHVDMPPSLHKYLYAYQNPGVYWDPDGRKNVYTHRDADGNIIGYSDRPQEGQLGTVERSEDSRGLRKHEEEAKECTARGGKYCYTEIATTPSEESGYNQHITSESESDTHVTIQEEYDAQRQKVAGSWRKAGEYIAVAGNVAASIVYWPKNVLDVQKAIGRLSEKDLRRYAKYFAENPREAAKNAALVAAINAACKGRSGCRDVVGDAKSGSRKAGRSGAVGSDKKAPDHHICTNKNCLSSARGGPWTPRFRAIFNKAGIDLNDAANRVRVPGHKGPHPKAYHEYVYKELIVATQGLRANTTVYTNAVKKTLDRIRGEAVTAGTQVNRWLTKQ